MRVYMILTESKWSVDTCDTKPRTLLSHNDTF